MQYVIIVLSDITLTVSYRLSIRLYFGFRTNLDKFPRNDQFFAYHVVMSSSNEFSTI